MILNYLTEEYLLSIDTHPWLVLQRQDVRYKDLLLITILHEVNYTSLPTGMHGSNGCIVKLNNITEQNNDT